MRGVNLFGGEVLPGRLKLLRQLAQSITREIDEIEKEQTAAVPASPQNDTEISLEDQVKRFEMDLIRFALFKTSGKQNSAAEFLKIKRTTLNAKIKRYNISVEAYRVAKKSLNSS